MENKTKPKIALMTYTFDKRQGKGTALYARKLVENLISDDRFDFYLVHYEKITGDSIYENTKEILMPKIKLPYASHFLSQIIFFWKYRNNKFDIIHWFQPRLYPFFWFAPAKKIVVTAHGAADITSLTTKQSFVFSREVFNFLMRKFNRFISAVIAVSNFGKEEIIKYYEVDKKKVYTIYNGGSEDFKVLDKRESQILINVRYGIESPFILDISRLEPHKNVQSLVKSYIVLRDKYSVKHKLVIVGNKANCFEEIFKIVKNSNYEKDIMFVDYVKTEDLNTLYSASDLFVFPSLNEGFGLPIVESMASGTPVVTSDVTSIPEVSGGATRLINPLNIENMAKEINEVLSNQDEYKDLSRKGIIRSRDFTWHKTAEDTMKLYLELLDSK
jgi:glycosyltransferase involved in cell wall biosynthesis